jgi:hypothetical protein
LAAWIAADQPDGKPTPGVFFHHSGHTHRNKRTFLLDNDQSPVESVEFLEVGATKEYPGGYSLLRLYTGGYMVSYYKNRTPLALAWSQRSRGEYYSLYPHYMLGTIADRNHTVTRACPGSPRPANGATADTAAADRLCARAARYPLDFAGSPRNSPRRAA